MKKVGIAKWMACLLAVVLVAAMVPNRVMAADKTMTLSEFIAAVEQGNGTFDGQGVVVQWAPDEKANVIQRVQEPNAQYQLFKDLGDLSISNVNFEYVPADIPQHSDGWSGLNKDWTKEQIRNAEFQFLNSGSVTIRGCTFEKVIVSPFGNQNNRPNDANRTLSVTGSSFQNVYNAYALKDIYPASATISENTFTNCSGAIYFEGGIPRTSLVITNNKFDTIDQYAASGKENTRGVVQFSSSCQFAGTANVTLTGNQITGNVVKDEGNSQNLPVVRQLCDMAAVTLNGWTPGQAFSIKIDAEGKTLPTLPSGTVDGNTYTFKGWAPENDYIGSTDLTNEASFLQPGDSASVGFYYAVWQVTYTVTYTDGVAEEDIFPDQVTTGLSAGEDMPTFLGVPERKGYVFTGWDPVPSETVTGSVTYTATWGMDENGNGLDDKDEPRYTVTYTDGVDGEEIFADQVTEDLLSGIPTPAFAGSTERDGYVFTGWTPEVSKTVTEDVVYTAMWEKKASSEDSSQPVDSSSEEGSGGTTSKPDDSSTGQENSEVDTGPETGDHRSWILLVSMLLTSAAALAGTAAFLKRKAK